MRMLAVGSSQKTQGFTLLELLVVLTIIAIATAGVTFAFRDNQSTLLEREAERLSVILETARVQSRSSGVSLAWVRCRRALRSCPLKPCNSPTTARWMQMGSILGSRLA